MPVVPVMIAVIFIPIQLLAAEIFRVSIASFTILIASFSESACIVVNTGIVVPPHSCACRPVANVRLPLSLVVHEFADEIFFVFHRYLLQLGFR